MTKWTIQNARDTYNTGHWGHGYFDVNAAGHLSGRPIRDPQCAGIDLSTFSAEIKETGRALPVGCSLLNNRPFGSTTYA